jgi:hypothetical protein
MVLKGMPKNVKKNAQCTSMSQICLFKSPKTIDTKARIQRVHQGLRHATPAVHPSPRHRLQLIFAKGVAFVVAPNVAQHVARLRSARDGSKHVKTEEREE